MNVQLFNKFLVFVWINITFLYITSSRCYRFPSPKGDPDVFLDKLYEVLESLFELNIYLFIHILIGIKTDRKPRIRIILILRKHYNTNTNQYQNKYYDNELIEFNSKTVLPLKSNHKISLTHIRMKESMFQIFPKIDKERGEEIDARWDYYRRRTSFYSKECLQYSFSFWTVCKTHHHIVTSIRAPWKVHIREYKVRIRNHSESFTWTIYLSRFSGQQCYADKKHSEHRWNHDPERSPHSSRPEKKEPAL